MVLTFYSYGILLKKQLEREILHEITMEPAHNHVGPARTVPFSQAVPGMYVTSQIEGEDLALVMEELNKADVWSFVSAEDPTQNRYITGYDLLKNRLVTTDHAPSLPTRFRAVPDDAPVLLNVLKLFQHDLELNHDELPNAKGIIVINSVQPNLKRLDFVIMWDSVEIAEGEIVKNEDGTPKLKTYVDNDGNTVVERRVEAMHFYLHEDSAYFD